MSVQLMAQNVPAQGRRIRRPVHTFNVRPTPYVLQPICLAPVLAGETLRNILWQARAVTDPIKDPIMGWHLEYYFFYVKLTDIDWYLGQSQDTPGGQTGPFVKMLLADPAWNPASYRYSGPSTALYGDVSQIQYASYCLLLTVNHYFRDERDVGKAYTAVGGLPIAKITNESIFNSYIQSSAMIAPDVNVDLNADATIKASEVSQALRRYEWMRANGLTDASYEDYLETFGISQAPENPHRPELLRYVRLWQYPSNTVDPVTGTPSSAVSWSVQERADKDRFFREPGFIFGLTCCRPKVYLGNQAGAAAGFMDRAEDWLPAALWSDPYTSQKQFGTTNGPIKGTVAGSYVCDMRDILLYGDQFVQAGLGNVATLPSTADDNKKYLSSTDINAFFKSATVNTVRQDGIINLTIAGTQQDFTART